MTAAANSNEEWRPVPWAPHYDVSRDGRIRSWVVRRGPRTNYAERAEVPRLLEPRFGDGKVAIYTGPGESTYRTPRALAREVFGDGGSNVG